MTIIQVNDEKLLLAALNNDSLRVFRIKKN